MFLSTKETRSDWRSPPWKHWSCSCRVSVHRFSVFRRQNLKTETIAWEWDPCKVSRTAITEHGTEAAFQSNVMGCNKLDNRAFPQKRLISISLFAALCSSLSFHSLWHFYTEKRKEKNIKKRCFMGPHMLWTNTLIFRGKQKCPEASHFQQMSEEPRAWYDRGTSHFHLAHLSRISELWQFALLSRCAPFKSHSLWMPVIWRAAITLLSRTTAPTEEIQLHYKTHFILLQMLREMGSFLSFKSS